jgi:hypothetical protein
VKRAAWISGLCALILVTSAVILVPAAQASADECRPWWGTDDARLSCVEVIGRGRWVDSVRGGVQLKGGWADRCVTGWVDVWWRGQEAVRFPERQWCRGPVAAGTRWAEFHKVDRELPAGTQVCSQFHEKVGHNSYEGRGFACVEITD